MSDPSIDPIELTRRLDNLDWSSWHTKLTIILGIGWAFDAYEITIVSSVLPTLRDYFHISSNEAGIITTVWLMGALIGAVGFGYFGDRFGRKLSFVVTICSYSLMTVIAACSVNYPMFLLFRFLTAIGVGAEYTAVNATISEFIPSRHRGKVNTLVMSFWAVGALVANALQYPILKYLDPSIAWRVGFATGGAAAIFVLIVRKSLPESPRWVMVQGRYTEADAIVSEIERLSGQPDNIQKLPERESAPVAYVSAGKLSYPMVIKELFTKYPYRVAFGMIMNSAQAFADYGESNLMSLGVLADSGITGPDVPIFYLFGTLSSIPAYLLAAFSIDYFGRKRLLPALFINGMIATAVIIPAYYSQDTVASITGAHCYYQFSYFAIMSSVYPSITEAFPTHLRATGIGVSVAAGRIIAAVAPYILLTIYESTSGGKNVIGSACVIIGFLGMGLLMSLSWAVFGIEGKNRTLEDMNQDSPTSEKNSKMITKSDLV